MSLEFYYKKFIASPFHILAYPITFIVYLILKIKKWLTKAPLSPTKPFVISIGNLDFGGSGKTPTLLLLLEHFQNSDCAVISRGYKSACEHLGSTYVNELPAKNASLIGDEPMLIHSKFSKIPLFVGKDKGLSLAKCAAKQVVFLDDGAQSHAIKKDISIILLDPQDPIKLLFPAGYRRDLLDTLKRADFVIVPYCQTHAMYLAAKAKIEKYTKAPVCGFKSELLIDNIDKKIALLTSIARPERLKAQLLLLGYDIVYQKILDDHQPISETIILDFEQEALAHHAKALCVTEKDIVKISDSYKNKFSTLALKLVPAFDVQKWESFIGKIEKMS